MAERRRRGPWYYRVLVWLFSGALALLLYWLLGFVLLDIGTWPGPNYQEVELQVLGAENVAQSQRLQDDLAAVDRDLAAKYERQQDLRASTDGAERTMNQLLEIQRLAEEHDRELMPAQREALDEATVLFLANQKQYQQINEEIAVLRERRRTLAEEQRLLNLQLYEQRSAAQERYRELYDWHRITMAALKLAVLVPLLLLVALAWVRMRGSTYVPLVYAAAAATAVRVMLVMHEHFPSRYFKYILVLAAIAVVAWLLVKLLRRIARPTHDWLLQQYREAYERFVCPICEFPIRRGPMRYAYWTRRTVKKLQVVGDGQSTSEAEPYVCPTCATRLYEPCEKCGNVRPSLLRACPHCGDQRAAAAIVAAGE